MALRKIAELTGKPLDWAVQEAELKSLRQPALGTLMNRVSYGEQPLPYSSDRASGGPILVREDIQVVPARSVGLTAPYEFGAYLDDGRPHAASLQGGSTRLEAAMRCYAISRLGETVDVPNSLLNPGPATFDAAAPGTLSACAAAA